jgi:hypothetical protein
MYFIDLYILWIQRFTFMDVVLFYFDNINVIRAIYGSYGMLKTLHIARLRSQYMMGIELVSLRKDGSDIKSAA